MGEIISQTAAQNVRAFRQRQGMSQEELAYKAQLSVRTIRAIESGQRQMKIQTVYKLCQALQVPASQLLSF
ncbi:MAG: helix-turn-helix transcriptional regulator [Anaerolineales bacterium]|nr:helix-turn-helix transcriptional regulator [Anaerolineales bacterium]